MNILEICLPNTNIYPICTAEHWLQKEEIDLLCTNNYYCAVHTQEQNIYKRGDVCIYSKQF